MLDEFETQEYASLLDAERDLADAVRLRMAPNERFLRRFRLMVYALEFYAGEHGGRDGYDGGQLAQSLLDGHMFSPEYLIDNAGPEMGRRVAESVR